MVDLVIRCKTCGFQFPFDGLLSDCHYTRDMELSDENSSHYASREEGLLTALEEMDKRVQRIAIVEDNPDAARLIRRILQAQGDFLIEEADNGIGGIQLIRQTRPNLVILDLMMPGLDGFSIVEAMKQDPLLHDIPIIVITAKELSPIERQRLNGKIKALLQKRIFYGLRFVERYPPRTSVRGWLVQIGEKY